MYETVGKHRSSLSEQSGVVALWSCCHVMIMGCHGAADPARRTSVTGMLAMERPFVFQTREGYYCHGFLLPESAPLPSLFVMKPAASPTLLLQWFSSPLVVLSLMMFGFQ